MVYITKVKIDIDVSSLQSKVLRAKVIFHALKWYFSALKQCLDSAFKSLHYFNGLLGIQLF